MPEGTNTHDAVGAVSPAGVDGSVEELNVFWALMCFRPLLL